MGNACDCATSIFGSSSSPSNATSSSYGEGTSSFYEDSLYTPGKKYMSNNNNNNSNNTSIPPRTPRHNNSTEHSNNDRIKLAPTPSFEDDFVDSKQMMPSPIQLSEGRGKVNTTFEEELMWENLRNDLRILDENLTKNTEILNSLPTDPAFDRNHQNSSSNGNNSHVGVYLGSLDPSTTTTEELSDSSVNSVNSIMMEAEEALRLIGHGNRLNKEENEEENEGEDFWKSETDDEDGNESFVHDSWDRRQ